MGPCYELVYSQIQGEKVTPRTCDLPGLSRAGRDTPAVSCPGRDTAAVSRLSCDTAGVSQLVLSLFPGIGLLDKGFEQAGFCVVRGPDLIYGGDILTFSALPGRFNGVIGGPPCQDFTKVNRTPGKYGHFMLDEFARVVNEASPDWWLMENVPEVPDVRIDGYSWQRIDLRASEFGLRQNRLRHFQYGSRDHAPLIVPRGDAVKADQPCCLASEGSRTNRRDWSTFCQLQGLPPEFDLPGWSTGAKYKAVGNGVPVPMAYAIAKAISLPTDTSVTPCACGCGRRVTGKAIYAGAACRKRAERRRKQGD